MLLMVGLFLPLAWIGGALSFDYSKVVGAQRQANNFADAAALAASAEFYRCEGAASVANCDTQSIDPAGARRAVTDFQALYQDPTQNLGRNMVIESVDVRTTARTSQNPSSVTVTVNYRVEDLYFFGLATGLNPSNTTVRGSAVQTAYVCNSNDLNSPTGGYCIRPRS